MWLLSVPKFAKALIQTRGTCDDVVALVPGGEQPVGSDLDSSLYLGFYTGRTVERVACEKLSSRIETNPRPTWVILDDAHLKQCLTPAARARYPSALLAGTQYLLSSTPLASPGTGAIDLTPLELDHLAVITSGGACQAPAYPRDLWHRYLEPR